MTAISRITEFAARIAGSKKDLKFFKVRFIAATTYKNLDGVVVGGDVDEEVVVTEAVAGNLHKRVQFLGQCTRDGTLIPIDAETEISLPPEPSPAAPSPFGEKEWDKWHSLSEQYRILRERVSQLRSHMNRFGSRGTDDSGDSDILIRGRRRAENALKDARAKLAEFDMDAMSALHLRLSRTVLAELAASKEEAEALEELALQLFETRVSALGLTRYFIASKLFGGSEVFFKYCSISPGILGPSCRLGFDELGFASPYSDEPVPALWTYVRPLRERRKELARLTKECRGELARAKAVIAQSTAA